MSDRLFLYVKLFDLLVWLSSDDVVSDRIDEYLLDAAEDPDLPLEDFAALLKYSDSLLRR